MAVEALLPVEETDVAKVEAADETGHGRQLASELLSTVTGAIMLTCKSNLVRKGS